MFYRCLLLSFLFYFIFLTQLKENFWIFRGRQFFYWDEMFLIRVIIVMVITMIIITLNFSGWQSLLGNLPHIRHMTFEVPIPFLVFLWWYNLVGNICWYISCIAAMVWVSTDLQPFIHAKHTPLSRAESSHLFLVSFPFHFSSPSVSQ